MDAVSGFSEKNNSREIGATKLTWLRCVLLELLQEKKLKAIEKVDLLLMRLTTDRTIQE